MIDTVKILIPEKDISLIGRARLSEVIDSAKWTKTRDGRYLPRLSYFKRPNREPALMVEFSIPKLLFGENFSEVKNDFFQKNTGEILDKLAIFGIFIKKEVFEMSTVVVLHTSKNIALPDGYTVDYIIRQLSKIDMRRSFDLTNNKYVMGGESLHIYSKSHGVIFYDKVADLLKPNCRKSDKSGSSNIYHSNFKKGTEILRIEVRLNGKRKINEVLSEIGEQRELTLTSLFDSKLSMKILNHYWSQIITPRNLSILVESEDEFTDFEKLLNNGVKHSDAIWFVGARLLAQTNGLRELKTTISKSVGTRSVQREMKEYDRLNTLLSKSKSLLWVEIVNHELKEYKAISIQDYIN